MAYYNSDRSHQGEKTRDLKNYTKRGSVKGRQNDKDKKKI